MPQVASVLLVRGLSNNVWNELFKDCKWWEIDKPRKIGRLPTKSDLKAYTIGRDLQDRLSKLLGKNAGPKLLDWLEQYDTMIAHAPSPLSDAQKHETDRVVKCFWEYLPARGEWLKARATAANAEACRELRERGMTAQLQAMQIIYEKMAAGEQVEMPYEYSDLGKAIKLWIALRKTAYDSYSVPEPDWDAPTTDSLEKEVHTFVKRVTDAMNKGIGRE